MKKAIIILTAMLFAACGNKDTRSGGITGSVLPDPDYDTFFTSERLRMDLVMAGNAETQHIYLSGLACESVWAGPKGNLIDPFDYGEYRYRAFTPDGQLIFSRGLSPLFPEWRSTEQADKVDIAMTQTLWMPFPKDSIHLSIEGRNSRTKVFETLLEFDVNPEDKLIARTPLIMPEAIQENGPMKDKVDLLFVPEGYSAEEMDLFREKARQFTEYLFQYEPYCDRREDFNIWMTVSPSQESGVDIPHHDIWRNTLCQSGFYTFYIDRYLTIQDHTALARAVASAPFDALFVIANDTKYGGGGFYNSYAMGTSDHRLSHEVFIHEFGHSFAGLADEYYDSEVAYSNDYYPNGIEPWEPNITNMTEFESKWKDMIAPETVTPTPNDSSYMNAVGLFEGAGYQTYGLYRPYFECRMKNNTASNFCPVCQRAISRMIDFYCGK